MMLLFHEHKRYVVVETDACKDRASMFVGFQIGQLKTLRLKVDVVWMRLLAKCRQCLAQTQPLSGTGPVQGIEMHPGPDRNVCEVGPKAKQIAQHLGLG